MGVKSDANMIEKLHKRIERTQIKLSEINQKIDEFEGENDYDTD